MSLWTWLFRWRQREADLDEEVQTHLRMAAREEFKPQTPLGGINKKWMFIT
jgi:hypothetical protein